MCTAVTYKTKDFYFGRTLDYEFSYGEEITVTPRNYIFDFRHIGQLKSHYAIIGMAFVSEGYPLYYDAVNEKGLGMAGLNFVGNAAYKASVCGEKDIAQFEFIPWILSQCATVSEARAKLDGINLTGTPFSSQLPAAQLHWIIADKDEAITVESMKDGLHIYDNPVGVLTNNPPFDMQMFALNNYAGLSSRQPDNTFADTQTVVVDEEGYITVKQEHCSSYVVTNKAPEYISSGSKDTEQDTQITESNTENASTDTSAPTDENVDTPQTSDSNNVYIYVACIIFALTGVIKYGKMKKVY